jgi:4-amino-4-deoxy-L-arabinose transferase-like glycosyltransferase
VAAAWWWQQHLPPGARFGFGDSEAYWRLAQTIARGEPYQMNPDRRVFRTPGYPMVLAALFRLVGDDPAVMWARGLNAVLGTAAVGGVIWLARLLFDQRTALLAGLVAALCPDAVAPSVFVLSEAAFCPLLVGQLLLATWAWQTTGGRARHGLALAAGVVAGWATLMRPSWLLFIPFTFGVALVAGPQRTRHLQLGVCLLLGLVAALSPWWVRNGRVVGRFVPTTLQVGESLYDGWNPQAAGGSDMAFVDEFRRRLRAEDAARGGVPATADCFEFRLDRQLRDAALAWAAKHPGRVVELAAIKFLRIWNVWPNEPSLRSPWLRAAVMCGYTPVLVFGLLGVWRFARRGWPYVLCFLPAVYFTALHVVFVGSLRYRQPALLPLIVLAAGAAGELVFWGRRRI